MNKIIAIFLVLIVFLFVIGGVSYMGIGPLAPYFQMPEKIEEAKEEEVELPPPAIADEQPGDYYYDLGSIIIPVFKNQGFSYQVEVDLAIRVKPEASRTVANDLPRLKNAVILTLYDFIPAYVDKITPESKKLVHDRLYKMAQEMYGPDAIVDVLIKIMRVR